MPQSIGVTPYPRRTEIGPVIREPPRRWRRSAEIVAVTRPIASQPAVNAPNELSFVGPMVLPMERQRARLLGDRSFEVWHCREPIPASNAVNLAIPGAAAKTVIEPFHGWSRQPPVVATQEIYNFSLQRAVITLAVESGCTRSRIKAAVETP